MTNIKKSNNLIKNIDQLVTDTEKLIEKLVSKKIINKKQVNLQQSIIDSIPSPVFFKDMEGFFSGCNKAFELVFEITKEDIVGKTFNEILPEYLLNSDEIINKINDEDDFLYKNKGLLTDEIIVKRADEFNYTFIFYKASFTDDDDIIQGIIGILVDITEFKEVENQLKQNQEQLRLVTEIAPFALVMTGNFDYSVIYANQQANKVLMLPEDNDIIDTCTFFVNPEELTIIAEAIQNDNIVRDMEVKMKRYNDEEFWGLVSATPIIFMGEPSLLLAINDINERKALEQKLLEFATTDALTGINNRRYFLERGDVEVHRAKRFNHALSVLMLDIDFFKKVNDTYGNDVGDIAIKFMAKTCINSIRDIDIAGRLGGEEFAIVLPETNAKQAMVVAERIRQRIENAIIEINPELSIRFTVSIGIASLGSNKAETLASLLSSSDIALYESKHNGRNRITVALD